MRRYRALVLCLLLSLAFHATIVPLIAGLFGVHRVISEPKEVVYRTTRLEMTPRTRPQPHPALPQPHRAPPQPHRAPPLPRAVPRPFTPPQQRRELARIEPRAKINVPRVSVTTAELAGAPFEKTIARLRQKANPLSGVADAHVEIATPGPAKHYAFDFSASMGTAPHAEGVLTPLSSWHDGAFTYYYVRYSVEYADGTTETGVVPWPLRYLPKDDPFLQHREHFPLPAPLSDFSLPAGTDLHPLVAFCYAHRGEFDSCPIQRA